MRCSDCSRELKPVVAFDIDGTLANYHDTFTSFAALYHNVTPNYNYDGSCDFEEWLGLTREQYREAKLAYRQGGNKRWLPPYDGAIDLLARARELGCEVWIATTRPWQNLSNIDPDTQEWLRRNGVTVDGLLYGEDKYQQLLDAVDFKRVLFVADDLHEQVLLAEAYGLRAIQIARQHNSADNCRLLGQASLYQLYLDLPSRITVWQQTNGETE